MDEALNSMAERAERARAALAEKPDGVVEAIAATAGVTPADVLAVLPEGAAVLAPADRWDSIWADLTGWGKVLLIVDRKSVV